MTKKANQYYTPACFDSIELGDQCKDSITGFEGVAVCKIMWLNGCNRVSIQPKGLKDGLPIEMQTFDWQQIRVLGSDSSTDGCCKESPKSVGGPHKDPLSRPNPTRR
jgi:hypothetical protein